MKYLKTIFYICIQNFRKWCTNYRIWIIAMILFIFVHSYSGGLSNFCDYTGIKSSPWIFPFIYMPYYSKLLFFFPLILLFCDAPFIDSNQIYVIIRSGRTKWCIGQIMYIIFASGVYFLYIIFLTFVVNFRCIEFCTEWGKILTTLAKTNACTEFNLQFQPNADVINLFNPFQAMWFTFVHSWLSGIILGLIIFAVNMISKSTGIGSFLASLILIFSAFASKHPVLIKYSPVTWCTLDKIKLSQMDNLPEYGYVLTAYLSLTAILIAGIFLISRKFIISKNVLSGKEY